MVMHNLLSKTLKSGRGVRALCEEAVRSSYLAAHASAIVIPSAFKAREHRKNAYRAAVLHNSTCKDASTQRPSLTTKLDQNYMFCQVNGLNMVRSFRHEDVQLTWGATKTAEVGAGLSGGAIALHPEEDNTANASVRTPPSKRVMDD